MTHFGFGFIGSAPRKTPSAALAYHAFGSTSNPNWSFTATLGTAIDTNDFIIAFVTASAATLGAVTLGGFTLTSLLSEGSGTFQAYILSAANLATLGATASLVVNGTGTGNGCAVGLYRVSKADPTPIDMQGGATTASASAISVSLTATAANQLPIAGAGSFQSGATTVSLSLSGVTADYTEQAASKIVAQSGGRGSLTTSGGSVAVTATPSTAVSTRMIALLFQGHA